MSCCMTIHNSDLLRIASVYRYTTMSNCTRSAPDLHHTCTISTPDLHHICTIYTPHLHHICALSAPYPHHFRTIFAPNLCLICITSAVLHLCTSGGNGGYAAHAAMMSTMVSTWNVQFGRADIGRTWAKNGIYIVCPQGSNGWSGRTLCLTL